MNYNAPDRDTLRQYLLGRLDDSVELEDQISKAILVDDDLSELVESIEDEILEEYLDGTLDSLDREAVSNHFLIPPARQQKLRFFRLLQEHLAVRGVNETQADSSLVRTPERSEQGRKVHLSWKWSHVWIYGQAAALMIVAFLGVWYVSSVHKSQALLEANLALERAHSASLEIGIAHLQGPATLLTLVRERDRDSGITSTELTRSMDRLPVTIAIINHPKAASYIVELNAPQSTAPIWTAKLFPIEDAFGDILSFDLPARGLEAGHYSLAVFPEASRRSGYYYDFEVKLRK